MTETEKAKRHDWRGSRTLATCARCGARRISRGSQGGHHVRYVAPGGTREVEVKPKCEGER